MSFEEYAQEQVAKQKALWSFGRGVVLNWSPLAAALARFEEGRAGAVEFAVSGASIGALQNMLSAGAISSIDLTLRYLRRIRNMQHLNAVLELNPDALVIAEQLDSERAQGKMRGPLHGIPILLKDNIGTGDRMHNTAGARVLQNSRCDRDSFLARRLWQQGCVFLGKANLSEWANFIADEKPPNGFSVNGGQTRNPYGTFDVGGSSSGSGAATAADLCVFAVGTETHGSIIYPSLRNSLCGLKPSLGLISRDRIIPITDATDTAGPMARGLGDLCVLMNALTGYDESDAACRALNETLQGRAMFNFDFTSALRADGLQGKQVGLIDTDEQREGSDDALNAARRALVAAGATLIDVKLPELKTPFKEILNCGYKHGVAEYLRAVNAPVKSVAEVIAFNEQDAAARAPNGMSRMKTANNNSWSADEYSKVKVDGQAEARGVIHDTLRAHKLDLFVSLNQGGFDSHFVLAGAPLLAVPAGYLASGEPFGITFGGEWLRDADLIAAGFAFQQRAPKWQPPAGQ